MQRAIVDGLLWYHRKRREASFQTRLPALLPRSPHSCDVEILDGNTGAVRRTRDKVLILGGGPTRFDAPLDDPTYEVWCCNDLAPIAVDSERRFRADRWFELHPQDPVVQWRRRSDFWIWLATLPIPVYQFDRKDNARSVEYSLADVIRAGRDYFGCTFCYQIGLAYLEGFRTIALYGVDLLTAREATVERATVEWWLGFVEGRGVRVELPVSDDSIRMGNHPWRYAAPFHCEHERMQVYDWMRDQYRHTIDGFLRANRPPETVREYWAWRRAKRV